MRIQNVITGEVYTLPGIKAFHDPKAGTFAEYLISVIESTKTKQNDCRIMGMTSAEVDRFESRLVTLTDGIR